MIQSKQSSLLKFFSQNRLIKLVILSLLVIILAVIYQNLIYKGKSDLLIEDVIKQDFINEDKKKSDFKNESPLTTFKPKSKFVISPSEAETAVRFLKHSKSLVLDHFEHLNRDDKVNLSMVTSFNNKLAPLIQSIVQMDYFKFVKLNLKRRCTLWPDNAKCSLRFV